MDGLSLELMVAWVAEALALALEQIVKRKPLACDNRASY